MDPRKLKREHDEAQRQPQPFDHRLARIGTCLGCWEGDACDVEDCPKRGCLTRAERDAVVDDFVDGVNEDANGNPVGTPTTGPFRIKWDPRVSCVKVPETYLRQILNLALASPAYASEHDASAAFEDGDVRAPAEMCVSIGHFLVPFGVSYDLSMDVSEKGDNPPAPVPCDTCTAFGPNCDERCPEPDSKFPPVPAYPLSDDTGPGFLEAPIPEAPDTTPILDDEAL